MRNVPGIIAATTITITIAMRPQVMPKVLIPEERALFFEMNTKAITLVTAATSTATILAIPYAVSMLAIPSSMIISLA